MLYLIDFRMPDTEHFTYRQVNAIVIAVKSTAAKEVSF